MVYWIDLRYCTTATHWFLCMWWFIWYTGSYFHILFDRGWTQPKILTHYFLSHIQSLYYSCLIFTCSAIDLFLRRTVQAFKHVPLQNWDYCCDPVQLTFGICFWHFFLKNPQLRKSQWKLKPPWIMHPFSMYRHLTYVDWHSSMLHLFTVIGIF